ncbi:MAG: hypothetical protein H0V17_17785, partial [Deltaproteobacteria bacterium]|nr:hypothetical protein [Deltaproteobacteria bacterium]
TLAGTQATIRAADLIDDDGVDELIVTVDGGRRVHVFPVTSGASDCEIGDEILTDALATCSDVANAGDHLIALCDAGIRRAGVFRINADGTREETPLITLDGAGLELVVGEFDGDGVRDLAVKLGRAAEVSVQFLKQCPAHDVRSCQ